MYGVALFKGVMLNNGDYRYFRIANLKRNNWRDEIANYKVRISKNNKLKYLDTGDETFIAFTAKGNRYMIAAAPIN